jgi:CRP-like cAMP-binding protein
MADMPPFDSRRTHPQGTILEVDGDGDEILYVASGDVLTTAFDDMGNVISSCLHSEGDFIGLERLVGVAPPYEVLALVEIEVARTTAPKLRNWHEGDPKNQTAILHQALRGMARSIDQQVMLRGTAVERTARFLDRIHESEAAHLTLPRRVIARLLHVRPETLSRALRQLQDAGAIETTPSAIAIHEPAVLRSFANSS